MLSNDKNEGFFCHSCGEYHDYLPMDIGFDYPYYKQKGEGPDTPNSDFYVIDTDYFIRGCLQIPVVDGPGPFVWGVWTSLSEKNFKRAQAIWRDDAQSKEPPYFGWFASKLPDYPDTINLKTMVHLRPGGLRPWIELDPTNHPLAVEQREGITMSRVYELLRRIDREPRHSQLNISPGQAKRT